jgi:ATP-dependent DNA helicase RecG
LNKKSFILFLEKEIKYLPGVGPKRAELLNKELDIYTYQDLLYYFPYRYIDKTKFYAINEITPDLPYIQIKGYIKGFRVEGVGRTQRLSAIFTDGTGEVELIWFKGIKWIQNSYKTSTPYIIFGKPNLFKNRINIPHPEIEPVVKQEETIVSSMQAMYSTTEKLKNNFLTSKAISKIMNTLLQQVKDEITETLPEYLVKKINLMPLKEALFQIHFPENPQIISKAETRLKFDELFYIQLNILKLQSGRKKSFKGYRFEHIGQHFNTFYKENLHFELTNAQKRVIKEIRKDMNTGIQMNRLLQGDVGSGKTIVALMTGLIAIDNGFQTAIMAPTEILAFQHFQSIQKSLTGIPLKTVLLTGTTKKSERKKIIEALQTGEIHIIIGTHALIEDDIQFAKLGLVVIDEQHRFGVAQRATLWKKNPEHPPHVLVMTATPIPRTLAMTVYGDLDISVIDELPPGRKPIVTQHYFESKRLVMFGFLRQQIKAGRQVYIVYPLIKESESLDYANLNEGCEAISRAFPLPEYNVVQVHGKMKQHEKDLAMSSFKKGEANILVATTVIEVGVDVPNASVMIIESAERFGLAQLHQLRGRVGRGAEQSYCILMTGNKLSNEARLRLATMVKTTDGFVIAEADMKLRGYGDIEGTQQSGLPFNLKIANLSKDGQLLQYSRNIAEKILAEDSELAKPENKILADNLKKFNQVKTDWSIIS